MHEGISVPTKFELSSKGRQAATIQNNILKPVFQSSVDIGTHSICHGIKIETSIL